MKSLQQAKPCAECAQQKPLSKFGINSKAHDGRKIICKECEAKAKERERDKIKQFFVIMGLPAPVAELQFEPLRGWAFDWAWPEAKIALEVEGGVWSGGRHTTGKGFVGDMAKYNRAACLGWRVLRVQPIELLTLATVQMVKEARCV